MCRPTHLLAPKSRLALLAFMPQRVLPLSTSATIHSCTSQLQARCACFSFMFSWLLGGGCTEEALPLNLLKGVHACASPFTTSMMIACLCMHASSAVCLFANRSSGNSITCQPWRRWSWWRRRGRRRWRKVHAHQLWLLKGPSTSKAPTHDVGQTKPDLITHSLRLSTLGTATHQLCFGGFWALQKLRNGPSCQRYDTCASYPLCCDGAVLQPLALLGG